MDRQSLPDIQSEIFYLVHEAYLDGEQAGLGEAWARLSNWASVEPSTVTKTQLIEGVQREARHLYRLMTDLNAHRRH